MSEIGYEELFELIKFCCYKCKRIGTNILKRRRITIENSQNSNTQKIIYGDVYSYGKSLVISHNEFDNPDNWDVFLKYIKPGTDEIIEINGLINIEQNFEAKEILIDILNKFFLRKEGEIFIVRGIGLDFGGKDYVCRANIAAFVESKEAGERVVEMFRRNTNCTEKAKKNMYCFVDGGDPAWLDYRYFEPNWIQVKVGACDEHKKCLENLYNLVLENDNIITDDIIIKAQQESCKNLDSEGIEK